MSRPTGSTRSSASGRSPSGLVPLGVAYAGAVVLLAGALALALAVNVNLALTVGGYVALTTAYSSILKHVAVVDLVAVAAGFVLRAVAGAAATGVPVSQWFFIVTSFGALFMISGKRAAEAAEMGDDASEFRSVLAAYSTSYTAYLRAVTSGGMLVAYCMWAFEKAADSLNPPAVPWYHLSILPFVMAVLRYALVLDQGAGLRARGDRPARPPVAAHRYRLGDRVRASGCTRHERRRAVLDAVADAVRAGARPAGDGLGLGP